MSHKEVILALRKEFSVSNGASALIDKCINCVEKRMTRYADHILDAISIINEVDYRKVNKGERPHCPTAETKVALYYAAIEHLKHEATNPRVLVMKAELGDKLLPELASYSGNWPQRIITMMNVYQAELMDRVEQLNIRQRGGKVDNSHEIVGLIDKAEHIQSLIVPNTTMLKLTSSDIKKKILFEQV